MKHSTRSKIASSSSLLSVFIIAVGICFVLAPAVRAQNTNAVRVVRLSRAEGQVLVAHSGSDLWEEASVNLPLQEGDTLATQSGLAEIEFENGATIFLADNSTVQFTQIGFSNAGRATELTLTEGAATFYANLTVQDTFLVRTSTLDVAVAERAQFRVDVFQGGAAEEGTSVQMLLGNVAVSTAKGSTNLEKGQTLAVHGKDFQDLNNIARLQEEDSFDQWVTQEGERIRSGNKNTLSYITSPNEYGLSDLSVYGSWINFPGLGISWRPFSTGAHWQPFLNGSWTLDPRLGWIWVSSEPWGWMPYHFGSWFLSPVFGWIWVPGGPEGLQQWQPARVNWVHSGNQIGWVAKSPNDHEGTPANIAQGIVTKPATSPLNGNSPNEILSGRHLQNVTELKNPPPELASKVAQSHASGPVALLTPRSGVHSTIRIAPWTLNNNPTIVYDNRTHTYVNREDGRMQRGYLGNMSGEEKKNELATPTVPTPRLNLPTRIPRATIPSAAPANSLVHRPVPAARPVTPTSHANALANRTPLVRPPLIAPNVPSRAGAPPASRPVSPSATPRTNPAQHP